MVENTTLDDLICTSKLMNSDEKDTLIDCRLKMNDSQKFSLYQMLYFHSEILDELDKTIASIMFSLYDQCIEEIREFSKKNNITINI